MNIVGKCTLVGLRAINTIVFQRHKKRISSFSSWKFSKGYTEAEALANNFKYSDMKYADAIIEKQNAINA